MKISIVSTMTECPWGGSEELWSLMALRALERGHSVRALVSAWPNLHPRLGELAQKGAEIQTYREYNTSAAGNEKLGREFWYPYQSINESRPDIVCVSHGGLLDVIHGHRLLIGLLFQQKLRYVVLIQANTDLYFPETEERLTLRQYFQNALKVCFVSQQNLSIAEHQLGCRISNGIVVDNPVNLTSTEAAPWPDTPHVRFASVARICTLPKGHDILLSTLGQPMWREREWSLSLYGKGPDESLIQDLAKMYEIENRLTFHGQVEDIRKVWERSHILVMPSRLEGTSLALLEASALGRPAVVTEVGGNADWVKNNETGFVASAATRFHVAEAMQRAWDRRADWRAMGQRARELFLSKHSCRQGATLLDLLEHETATHATMTALGSSPEVKRESPLQAHTLADSAHYYSEQLRQATQFLKAEHIPRVAVETASSTPIEQMETSVEDLKIIAGVLPFTAQSPKVLGAVLRALQDVERRSVPGAVVEVGSWAEQSALGCALKLQNHDSTQREFYLLDSPTSGNNRHARPDTEESRVTLTRFEQFQELFRTIRYPEERLHVLSLDPGAAPTTLPREVALLIIRSNEEETRARALSLFGSLLHEGTITLLQSSTPLSPERDRSLHLMRQLTSQPPHAYTLDEYSLLWCPVRHPRSSQ